MLFLGVLSVFQLILIPGLLLIRLFPAKRSFIQQFAYVFMLSLLANYLAVFFLVSIHLYLRSVVLLLFAVELVLLGSVYRERLFASATLDIAKAKSNVSKGLHSLGDWLAKDFWSASFYIVFGAIAILAIAWVLMVWGQNFGTVFQAWDSWASWDRWAENWAQNLIPGDTWEYPQLVPVVLSLAYKFIGTTAVKFFGKSIMPLFALLIVLMLFDLGKKYRSYGYMLGAGLAFYGINLFLAKYLPEAYVDIPVACFSFMAVYTLLKARDLTDWNDVKSTLLLGSLSTAAAAVTKQPGLYLLAFYPIFAYLWIFRGHKKFKSRMVLTLLAKHLLLTLVIVLPWYALMEYRILVTGENTSNIQFVITDIYKGQSLSERFLTAVQSLGGYIYFYVFLLLSLSVVSSEFRQIIILVIFPYSILWAFFLSYEYRNLAIAFPFIGMAAGVAAQNWIQKLTERSPRKSKRNIPAYALLLIGFLIVGIVAFRMSEKVLIQKQLSEQKDIFQPSLNSKLYSYFSRENGPEPIITDYPINWLPGLKGLWRFDRFQNYDLFEQNLIKYADAELLLIPLSGIDLRIFEAVRDGINSGLYEVVFTDGDYQLLRIPPR